MGLTSFKGAKIRKSDIDTAKNYLTQEEITNLNRVVSMYLDYAEDQAVQHKTMYMADWEAKLNDFLKFTGREVLEGAGSISAERAKELASQQYDEYDKHRKIMDIEIDELMKEAKRLKGGKK